MAKPIFFFVLFSLIAFNKEFLYAQEDENITHITKGITYQKFENSGKIVDVKLNFNKNWRFQLGDVPGFYEMNFNDNNWRKLNLPHDWSVEGKIDENNPSKIQGGFFPTGIGCYRKSFDLDANFKGKRIKIRFDGVYMNSSVYVNGNFVANRPYGFSTFELDITPYLNFDGGKNLVAVRVDNSLQPSSRWYTGSGINRNVYLIVTEQQHFQSFKTFFKTDSIKNKVAYATVACQIVSNNYNESEQIKFQARSEDVKRIEKDAKVVALLKDQAGNIIAQTSQNFKLKDYQSKDIQLPFHIKNPLLWSAVTPNLYKLDLQLWINDELVNNDKQEVGIRKITFDSNAGMFVNGEKVVVKGVCLHKDAGSFGTAVPKDVWRFRLSKLKALGCNAIRTHGPVDPIFLDVCDEMGFYVMAEAFDEWERNWQFGLSEDPTGKVPYGYHLFFKQWAKTDLQDMVKRDRNRPSVFMYSIGNEVPEQRFDEGTKTLVKLKNWVKDEDKTRPVTVGADWSVWANKTGFMDSLDVAGYNYPDRYFKEQYKEQHLTYPNRVLLGTENYEDLNNWLKVRDNKFVVGLFLWVGIDYLGEAVQWPRKGWEWGLIDIASFEKPLYYYWQAFWSAKPMVHIAVKVKNDHPFEWKPYSLASHWNFSDKDSIDTVYVMSNTDEVELFQNGKSLGRKKVNPDTYQAIYHVKYKDGELTANAYRDTKLVATHSLKTAREPVKLAITKLQPEDKTSDDGLIFLSVEMQDKLGTRCPFGNSEVKVSVEGAGELVGLDSGDQFNHELYKQNSRKAYQGRLLLTIKPTGVGYIKIKCTADGLKDADMKIANSRLKTD